MGSGIYYGNMDKDLLRVADHCLRDGDKVVGIMTYGGQAKLNGRDLDGVCRAKFATLLCMYGCPGYDTYGPFKFVGGMNKERPNQEDCNGVVEFFDHVIEDYTDVPNLDNSGKARQAGRLQRGASHRRPDERHQALRQEDRQALQEKAVGGDR